MQTTVENRLKSLWTARDSKSWQSGIVPRAAPSPFWPAGSILRCHLREKTERLALSCEVLRYSAGAEGQLGRIPFTSRSIEERELAQRKSGHVTLADVARACGFAVSTVPMVLSEAPFSQHVAARSREHIRAVARQLGYHPDAYAGSLSRRRSQTVGVLAFDLSDPFCIPVVRGIQDGLQPANYLPLLMDSRAQRGLFDGYLQMVLERRPEGIIVIASWVFGEGDLLADSEKN